MKNKKVIICTTVVGVSLLLGIGLMFRGNNLDKNTPAIIKEGKELAKSKDVEQYVDNAFKMLKKHGPMSNDIWQGYTLEDKNILVAEKDSDTDKVLRGWLLTTTTKKELTSDEINKINFPNVGGYDKVIFDNKQSISLSISKDILKFFSLMDFNYLYDVAVHEMYHFYVDDMKKYDDIKNETGGNEERYTEFPKDAMPRVYRKMIYDNIASAYENPSDQDLYLGRAKYWNEKWKNDYPKEHAQSKVLDIAEGKARYVEYLLCIDYKNISKEEKTEAIKSLFNKSHEVADGISDESYELGFVSGVLLDKVSPNWKEEITTTPERPVEMLLSDVKVVKDDSNNFDKVFKKATSQMKKVNKKLSKQISNIEESENNKNIPLLQLSDDFMTGSFSTTDFIEYKGNVVVVNLSATFETDNGLAKINEVSSYLLNNQGDTYALPLTMKYKLENNKLVISEKGVSVDIKVKETKSNDGRIVYVMQ